MILSLYLSTTALSALFTYYSYNKLLFKFRKHGYKIVENDFYDKRNVRMVTLVPGLNIISTIFFILANEDKNFFKKVEEQALRKKYIVKINEEKEHDSSNDKMVQEYEKKRQEVIQRVNEMQKAYQEYKDFEKLTKEEKIQYLEELKSKIQNDFSSEEPKVKKR